VSEPHGGDGAGDAFVWRHHWQGDDGGPGVPCRYGRLPRGGCSRVAPHLVGCPAGGRSLVQSHAAASLAPPSGAGAGRRFGRLLLRSSSLVACAQGE